jgi:hypothetical protein
MKKYVVIILAVLFTFECIAEQIPPYTEGTKLNVFASSGLKLRAFPNLQSEVIDIVRYGDRVEVLNTFAFTDEKADRIDWIDGHWILVEYDGIAGYLFDGYLSPLPFPGSEEELCQDGYSFAYTLLKYFNANFERQQVLDSNEYKIIYLLDQGIKIKNIINENHWATEIELPQLKINEVLNVMRSMLPDKTSRQQFESSLIFIEGPDNKVAEVKVQLGDKVVLKNKPNGNLLVKASGAIGC